MEYRKMDSHSAYPDAPFLWHKMPVFKSASPRFAVSFQSAVLVLIAQVWTESQDHRLGVSSKIAQATGGLGNRSPLVSPEMYGDGDNKEPLVNTR